MPFPRVCAIGIKFPSRGSLVFIHMVSLPWVSHQFSFINVVINQGSVASPFRITAHLQILSHGLAFPGGGIQGNGH